MRLQGFTMIELLLVLVVVALLASIVGPIASSSIHRAREATLKEDLFLLRKAIDDYYADNGSYPTALDVLVEKRYIRKVPPDPLTERVDSWTLIREGDGDDNSGIVDVHSSTDELAIDGSPLREW